MTRTPLDQFIIETNAIDIAAMTGEPVPDVITRADQLWDQQTPHDRGMIRSVYAPTFHRVAARVIEDAVDALETMHVGAQGAPYVSATKAQLRSTAREHRTKSEE